jgi:DNA-binding transcriptional regulator PaaX
VARAREQSHGRWLLLIHSIPPHPAYFRAKIGKRLARVGAVAIKNSVYVLPSSDQQREDFQWIARAIVEEGGEATLCDATFVEGLQNEHVEALFRAARQADYEQIGEEVRADEAHR